MKNGKKVPGKRRPMAQDMNTRGARKVVGFRKSGTRRKSRR